jgi:endonuclease-3
MDNSKIENIYNTLSQIYPLFSEQNNEWTTNGLNNTPFKNLVSVNLSTMTHTKRVIRAATALFAEISTPQELLQLSDEHLTELIKPVAHYNRKTKMLKEMCQQLIEKHDGQVPRTREELLALKGVGRKSVDILMNFSFGKDTIAVDTHVHRVLNRTGVVKTKNAEESADIINEITPDKYKKHAHEWLIQHGMKTCFAKKPNCKECKIHQFCDWENKES